MLHHMLRAAAQRAFNILDPYFQYVTMLLHGDGTNGAQNNTFLDSSTNNFTITRNGNTTQGTFTPYGSNWSNYMTSGYLTTASNADFALSADFTVECWVFSGDSSLDGSTRRRIFHTGGGDVAASLQLLLGTSAGNSAVISVLNNGFLIDGTISVVTSSWNHVAVTRSGTSLKLFVNGVQSGSTATTSQNFNSGTSNTVYIGANSSGGGIWQGYISNLSVVNGTALYTSAFTPPTAPLSTGTTNQKLLVCQVNRFIDSNTATTAKTITVNSTPSVQRFSPFSPTTAYSTSVIGGSGYFDGSGDYLTTPSSADFGFSTGDFTVECWVYPLSSAAQRLVFFSNDMNNLDIGFSPANTFQYYNGSVINTGISAASQQWFHFAASRTSGTTSVYVNGVRTNNVSDTSSTTTRSVLVASSSGTFPFNGYINDVRVIKGTGIYSGTTITVPTAPLTAVTNTKLLLNYTNAGILDNAMMNDLETVGNAQISTSVKKYGTGSMLFDGNGDNLSGPTTPNLNMSTGNWTIECWVYILSRTLNYPLIFGNNNGGYTAGALSIVNSNADSGASIDRFCLSVKDISNAPTLVASSTNSSNTWYHLAVVRNGTSLVMYRDGTSVASTTISSSIVFDWGKLGSRIGGGNWDGAQSYFNGYIDDLRITKGFARYTATFTPPTAAFPNN